MEYENLGKAIVDLYTRSVFAKTLKSEIDLIVFSHVLNDYLIQQGKTGIFEDVLAWYQVDSKEIRDLSLKLGIRETTVNSFIEQSALASGLKELSTAEAIGLIKALSENTRQIEQDVKNGYISLYISNSFTKKSIEAFLAKGKGIPDTSFNRNILKVRIIDIMVAYKDGEISINFVKDLVNRVKEHDKAFRLKKSLNELTESNRVDFLKEVLLSILASGASSCFAILFDSLSNVVTTV